MPGTGQQLPASCLRGPPCCVLKMVLVPNITELSPHSEAASRARLAALEEAPTQLPHFCNACRHKAQPGHALNGPQGCTGKALACERFAKQAHPHNWSTQLEGKGAYGQPARVGV